MGPIHTWGKGRNSALIYLAQRWHFANIVEEMKGKGRCFNATGFAAFFLTPVIR